LETVACSESFRKQKFHKGLPIPPPRFEQMSFRERIIYYLFSNTTIWGSIKFFAQAPDKLGLNINYDTFDLLKAKDKRYKYPYELTNSKYS
jgi:hypothetical protein